MGNNKTESPENLKQQLIRVKVHYAPMCAYIIIYISTIMALPEGLANSMKKFQAHNDLPVFLKGGPADKVLFGLTVGLCGLGMFGILQMVYTMGFKKKSA